MNSCLRGGREGSVLCHRREDLEPPYVQHPLPSRPGHGCRPSPVRVPVPVQFTLPRRRCDSGAARSGQRPADRMVDHVIDRPRTRIERRHGRRDDRTRFRRGDHRAQVTEVQRGLADRQQQWSALLQTDVRGRW